MDYMELFEPVDEVQTARNVRNFFNKDLDKLLRMANEVPSFLRSPVIDDMPKSPSFKNGSEEILVNHFESKSYIAKSILIGVSKALNNCRLIHKQILIAKYLDDMYDWQIMQRLNYEKTRYAELKINALNEFRNKLLEEEKDPEAVDEVLLKVLDAPDKKRMFPRKYADER